MDANEHPAIVEINKYEGFESYLPINLDDSNEPAPPWLVLRVSHKQLEMLDVSNEKKRV